MATTKSVQKTFRLPQDLLDAAAAAGKEGGMGLPDFVRYALREAIDRQAGRAELAALEERIAAQLTRLSRRVGQVLQGQQLQIAVMDQYMKMALALEPDLVDEPARDTARAVGLRRHRQIMETLPAALEGPLAKLLAERLSDEGVA